LFCDVELKIHQVTKNIETFENIRYIYAITRGKKERHIYKSKMRKERPCAPEKKSGKSGNSIC